MDLEDVFKENMIITLFIFTQFSGGKHNFHNSILQKNRIDDELLVDKYWEISQTIIPASNPSCWGIVSKWRWLFNKEERAASPLLAMKFHMLGI